MDEEKLRADGGTSEVAHQVFSTDVFQQPYEAERDWENDGATLFRFPDLPYSPVELVRRWESLRQTHRGFVQPMVQALTAQMDRRARFLSLVQALEGLHTQTVGEGATTVEEHRSRRAAVLAAVKEAGLAKEDLRWLKRWVDRYGRYSLNERLEQLRDAVREDVEGICDLSLIPGDLAELRNGLSHGAADYPHAILRPRIQALSAIAAAHLLRLLELPTDRLPRLFAVG